MLQYKAVTDSESETNSAHIHDDQRVDTLDHGMRMLSSVMRGCEKR